MGASLRRLWEDDAGGMVDEIVSIALLVIVGGAVFYALAIRINGALRAVGDWIDRIMPPPLP